MDDDKCTNHKQELQKKSQDKDISFMKSINTFQKKEMEYCDYVKRLECRLVEIEKVNCSLVNEQYVLEEMNMICNFDIMISSLTKQENDERIVCNECNDCIVKNMKQQLIDVEECNTNLVKQKEERNMHTNLDHSWSLLLQQEEELILMKDDNNEDKHHNDISFPSSSLLASSSSSSSSSSSTMETTHHDASSSSLCRNKENNAQ